jgi:hypothetical protein
MEEVKKWRNDAHDDSIYGFESHLNDLETRFERQQEETRQLERNEREAIVEEERENRKKIFIILFLLCCIIVFPLCFAAIAGVAAYFPNGEGNDSETWYFPNGEGNDSETSYFPTSQGNGPETFAKDTFDTVTKVQSSPVRAGDPSTSQVGGTIETPEVGKVELYIPSEAPSSGPFSIPSSKSYSAPFGYTSSQVSSVGTTNVESEAQAFTPMSPPTPNTLKVVPTFASPARAPTSILTPSTSSANFLEAPTTVKGDPHCKSINQGLLFAMSSFIDACICISSCISSYFQG